LKIGHQIRAALPAVLTAASMLTVAVFELI